MVREKYSNDRGVTRQFIIHVKASIGFGALGERNLEKLTRHSGHFSEGKSRANLTISVD